MNKCYAEQYTGTVATLNWQGFADPSEIKDVEEFDSSEGWNGYWSKNENTILFAGKEVELIPTQYLTVDSMEDASGNIVINLPENTVIESNSVVTIDGIEMNVVSVSGTTLTLSKNANVAYGNCNVKISGTESAYVIQNILYCTKIFSSQNTSSAAEFTSVLNATPDGYFVLDSDLDLAGGNAASNLVFSGIIDGQGYVVKNFVLTWFSSDNGEWEATMFRENRGTIKNIGFEYTLKLNNGEGAGLVYANYGTVSNVYVNATFEKASWDTVPVVALNYGGGIVENCLSVISANTTANTSCIFDFTGASRGGSVSNSYSINNGKSAGFYRDGWAPLPSEETGCYAYENFAEFLAAVTSFDSTKGWGSYWKIKDGKVYFGNTVIG